ncbi:TPA: fimbrial protein [Serratia fonticola]|uniref:fimbrial protein n=1 Tax=Serratia fonticola TaxID=47917 RepID=UPI0021795D2A|nr:fimbrial protein [Serratia fonticola]CAI1937276.1 putative fimbrial protein StaF [Serratia fonticola]
MRKINFSLTPAALVLLAVAGNVQAASNAQLTVTANVVAATCDVSLSTNNLDLGNFSPSQFTGVATPVPASQKTFTVGLSNCEAPIAAADQANLVISGQTLAGNPNLFNSTGTNTGIMLNEVSAPTAYLTNGQKLSVATAGATPEAGDFNAKTLSLQAGLASTDIAKTDIGSVSAPILFSFAYN